MAKLNRVIFSGGGTGGHLYPGLSVVEELDTRFPELQAFFVGSQRGIERRILNESGIQHNTLPIRPSTDLKRAPFSFAFSYLSSRRAARKLMIEVAPEVVIGLGGFASVPVIQVAQSLHIPTVLLEQNLVLGRANRWLMKKASLVCHSYSGSIPAQASSAKHQVTGNPVRKEIACLTKSSDQNNEEALTEDKENSSPIKTAQTILILGGSQGARAVNEMWMHAACQMADELSSRQILHQTGEQDCEKVREQYRELGLPAITEPYFEIMPTLYQQADLVISRAGATTLAELACAELPAVLIPYPNSVGDHQMKNAEYFARSGGAVIVEQPSGTSASESILCETVLSETMKAMLSVPLDEMQTAMRSLAKRDAAQQVADKIEAIAFSRH